MASLLFSDQLNLTSNYFLESMLMRQKTSNLSKRRLKLENVKIRNRGVFFFCIDSFDFSAQARNPCVLMGTVRRIHVPHRPLVNKIDWKDSITSVEKRNMKCFPKWGQLVNYDIKPHFGTFWKVLLLPAPKLLPHALPHPWRCLGGRRGWWFGKTARSGWGCYGRDYDPCGWVPLTA